MLFFDLPKMRENDNCFFLYLNLDGTVTVNPKFIKASDIIMPGINGVQQVEYNGKYGFLKDSSKTDSSDDMEIIINWIGRKLNISMAKTYRCLSSDGKMVALVSENVCDSENQIFITMHKVRSKIFELVKSGAVPHTAWMDSYIDLMKQKAYPEVETAFENIAYTESQAEEIINVGCRLIDLIPSDNSDKQFMMVQYNKMIFLDALVGQVDRNIDNYGFIFNVQSNEYFFSPLFDDATLRKPYTGVNTCMVNNFMLNRSWIFKTLLKHDYIKKLSMQLINMKYSFVDRLSNISKYFLNNEQYDLLMSNVLMGLFTIEKLVIP